jgi:uncharacterized membrane protein YgaE (UPF0421/DUF939 family)
MTFPTFATRPSPRGAARRLRPRLLPIAQTALAAVAAYYVALLLPIGDSRPTFASIAAVIALGATYRQRGRRAIELVGGVVLGLTVADVIIHLIGTGPAQIGLMIVLAMAVAVVLGGGELFVNEAAISGLIVVSLLPTSQAQQLDFDRPVEALVGGAVALAVGSVMFPPDPRLFVGRAANRVLGDLGWALEEVAAAIEHGDPERGTRALQTARSLDIALEGLEEALATARETARFAPARTSSRRLLDRYVRTLPHLDFAVRNVRILARHALRYSRSRLAAPDELPVAVRALASSVFSIAASYDEPERAAEARAHALFAAAHARESFEREPDLVLTEIIGQVRSTAVDLVRVADIAAGEAEAGGEAPTEELLAAAAA